MITSVHVINDKANPAYLRRGPFLTSDLGSEFQTQALRERRNLAVRHVADQLTL